MVTSQQFASFVNIISTPKGGTHVQGFDRAMTKAVNVSAACHKNFKEQ
jgi:DNA gyrase subunit B